jgi:trans-aconitate 2-methyltransferase
VPDVWQPDLYARFAAERRRPFDDLLGLVEPAQGPRVLDLGCGTGELTRVLHERLGARETLGLDRSAAMLERGAAHAAPGLRFERGDLGTFDLRSGDGGWDLVFSNAALHWVDDHEALLGRLTRAVAPGGQLAIQVPANFDHPSHRTADEVADEPAFRDALGGWRRGTPVLDPRTYAEVLHRLGWARQHVRLVVYAHVLPGPEAVIDWVRGTLLTAFEERLGAAGYAAFLERYRTRLLAALPAERPYLYGFKRILLWASKRAP